ncbi:hypothetical protein ACFQMB_14335 [Pseudobowmanella zhangzhouensis]|uniref:hypothetical protein n=1 Tax=Pseudobowmanella zhangzhouensis TaxID=1537679 RepID=UPI00360C7238
MGKGSTDIPETKAEQMQAQVAMRRWNDYQTLFKPYENKFMRRVDAMNGEAEMNVASDLSMRPLANAFAKEGLKIRNSMMQNGVNPNSGRFQSGIREGKPVWLAPKLIRPAVAPQASKIGMSAVFRILLPWGKGKPVMPCKG